MNIAEKLPTDYLQQVSPEFDPTTASDSEILEVLGKLSNEYIRKYSWLSINNEEDAICHSIAFADTCRLIIDDKMNPPSSGESIFNSVRQHFVPEIFETEEA